MPVSIKLTELWGEFQKSCHSEKLKDGCRAREFLGMATTAELEMLSHNSIQAYEIMLNIPDMGIYAHFVFKDKEVYAFVPDSWVDYVRERREEIWPQLAAPMMILGISNRALII